MKPATINVCLLAFVNNNLTLPENLEKYKKFDESIINNSLITLGIKDTVSTVVVVEEDAAKIFPLFKKPKLGAFVHIRKPTTTLDELYKEIEAKGFNTIYYVGSNYEHYTEIIEEADCVFFVKNGGDTIEPFKAFPAPKSNEVRVEIVNKGDLDANSIAHYKFTRTGNIREVDALNTISKDSTKGIEIPKHNFQEYVPISTTTEDEFVPNYETGGASCADLKARIEEGSTILLEPGKRVLVPTGVFIDLPIGFEALVRPRSGLALKHGITVLNSPGTIDADYRGEVGVILINLGEEDFLITRGMRIAQLAIQKIYRGVFQQKEKLSKSERGEKGFGSTGIK